MLLDQVHVESKQGSLASKRLVDTATIIRDLMAVHHKLMADVAVLLRYWYWCGWFYVVFVLN